MTALGEFLRPEFLSRVDEVVVFSPLDEKALSGIARLTIGEMKEPLLEKNIQLNVTDDAYDCIARKAKDGKFGGRDVRRIVRKEIEDKVANLIVDSDGKITAINISTDGDNLTVTGE